MKISACCILVAASFSLAASVFAANPEVVNGVATFNANKKIGTKFPVPLTWKKIVIKAGVTVTGSFYVDNKRKAALEIAGENWDTSVIKGDGAHDGGHTTATRQKSNIRVDGSINLYVHDLKSLDPVKFHIHGGFGAITVNHVKCIETRGEATTDGVHGGNGSTLTNSYINTFDDSTYVGDVTHVEGTTIVHNKNGSPFQIGWGGSANGHATTVKNCTIIAAGSSYNQGVVSAANVDDGGTVTMKWATALKRTTNSGAVAAPMYQFGTRSKVVNNLTIVSQGMKTWSTSIKDYGKGNKVVVK